MKVLRRHIFARLANPPGLAAGLLALATVTGFAQATFLTVPTTTAAFNRFSVYPYSYNELQVLRPLSGVVALAPASPLAVDIRSAVLADIATGSPALLAAGTPNFAITSLPRALDSLSANQYTMLRFVEIKATEDFFNSIDAHLAEIRLGTQGFATTTTTTYTQPAPTTGYGKEGEGKEAKAPVAPAPPPPEPKFSVWVTGIGNIGTLDTGRGAGIDRTQFDVGLVRQRYRDPGPLLASLLEPRHRSATRHNRDQGRSASDQAPPSSAGNQVRHQASRR
jgi:hypothetical protein